MCNINHQMCAGVVMIMNMINNTYYVDFVVVLDPNLMYVFGLFAFLAWLREYMNISDCTC